MLPDTYVQSLVAAALDYVDALLPPPPYQVTVPETAADQDRAGATGKPPSKRKRASRKRFAASRASPAVAAAPADNPAGLEGAVTEPAAAEEGGDGIAAKPPAGVDNATLAALLLADDAEPDDDPAAPGCAMLGGDGAAGTGAGCGAGGEGEGHGQPADPLGHTGEVGHHALFALPEAPELPPELAGEPCSCISAPNQKHGPELHLQAASGHADAPSVLVAQPQPQADAPAAPAPAEASLDPGPAQAQAPAQAAEAKHPEPYVPSARDLATALGALYAAYTLFETQPGAAGGDQGTGTGTGTGSGSGSRALLYVPPSRLLALGRLAAAAAREGVRDAVALLRRLIMRGALVVGAVRRPPCGADLLTAASGR